MANASYRRSTSGSYRSSSSSRMTSNCAPGYKSVFWSFNNKISAYRALCNQTTGSASYKRPTPTALSSFAGWINKGCNVYTVTPNQVSKWTPSWFNFNPNSTTGVKSALCNKFGRTTIKAVCRDKNGNFLVACTPTYKGQPFCLPC